MQYELNLETQHFIAKALQFELNMRKESFESFLMFIHDLNKYLLNATIYQKLYIGIG